MSATPVVPCAQLSTGQPPARRLAPRNRHRSGHGGVLPGEGLGVVEDKQVLGGAGEGSRAGQRPCPDHLACRPGGQRRRRRVEGQPGRPRRRAAHWPGAGGPLTARPRVPEAAGLAGFGWPVGVLTYASGLAEMGVLEVVVVFQAVAHQPVRADVR